MEHATSHRATLRTRILVAFAIVLVVLVGAAAWNLSNYYHADEVALAVVADKNGTADGVTIRELADGSLAFEPEKPIAGLVFYPGAKVQPEAYAPLMQELAEQDILCVITEPPFNLAILDMDAAEDITAQFPSISRWLIAGHSMGGVAAADYAARHEEDIDGVVFLASYPSADLSDFNGSALSITATEDEVLSRDNYERARTKMPDETHELVIEGGNHAGFGNYGDQAGDGQALITRDSQQAQVVKSVVEQLEAA